MSKKQILFTLTIILTIFMVGFVLRVESTNLFGIPTDEKAYYQDQNGLPYMYEMDSYYNYRLTKNYLEHGYTGDTKINGTEWDLHSYAPSGVPMDYPPLIIYLTSFVYKFINLFTSVPLLIVCFWLPAFLGPLAGLITYFFVRRYTNSYGAAVAGILAVTAPLYLVRTVPGWFDTDMFNVFFPILVTWLFVEAVTAQKFKNQIILSLSAAFSMFMFALAWNGWQYQFYLLVIFTIAYILWRKIKDRNIKNCAYILSIYFITTLLLVGIFTGFLNIISLFQEPQTLLRMLSPHGVWYPWPNVYVSVSELQKPSILDVMSGVGPAFFGGIFGIIWILRVMINPKLKKCFLNRMTWFFYLMLIAWTLVGFASLEEGSRFIILLIPPLVISSGILIGLVINYLSILKEDRFLNIFKMRYMTKIFTAVIILLVAIPAVFSVYESTCALQPGANDDLWNSALWINNNTPNDTVVVVEWGYGHLFSAIANRPVSFDGRTAYIETLSIRQFDSAYKFGSESPSSSREYWINHAFATDNQTLSLGIFRMLTTSGDMGYITLDQYTKNTTKSVTILNNILGVNNETAKEILLAQYGLNEEQAKNVIQYTHPSDPRPFVLVTSLNTLSRGKAIFKFGEWDFNDVKECNYTYSVGTFVINGTTLNSTNEVVMNMKTGDITWNGTYPHSVILIKNGIVKEQRIDNNSQFLVAVLMDVNKTVVMDKSLENSMFMKLWVENSNSTVFKPVYRKGTITLWEYV